MLLSLPDYGFNLEFLITMIVVVVVSGIFFRTLFRFIGFSIRLLFSKYAVIAFIVYCTLKGANVF